MATTKRKKAGKGYTYDEYAKKFLPKSLPEKPMDTAEYPVIHPPYSVLDRIVQESAQNSSKSEKHE